MAISGFSTLIFILPIVAIACGGGTSLDNTFRIAIASDITATNNPWEIVGPENKGFNVAVYLNRYSAPMKLSDSKFQWIPDLAADFPPPFEREGDFWVSTITFKDGIAWSDGEPVTAEDVAFTVNTALDLELSGGWTNLVNKDFIDRVEVVPGQNAAKYYLKAVDEDGATQTPGLAIWQYGVTQAPVFAEHFWAPQIKELGDCDEGDDACFNNRRDALHALSADAEPITGPMLFLNQQEGSFVAFERNQDSYIAGSSLTEYADGTVEEIIQGKTYTWLAGTETGSRAKVDLEIDRPIDQADTIFNIYSSQEAAVLALRDGEVDYYWSPLGLSAGLRDQLEGDPDITTIENQPRGFRYLGFNFDREPFNDCALRQAVALLIDRDHIATSVLQGAVVPAYALVPEGNDYWFNPDVERIGAGLTREARINRVVELLTEAGYTWDTPPSWDSVNRRVVAGEGLHKPDGTPITQRERLTPDGATETINTPFELISTSNGYDPLRATTALLIERWLEDAGIPTKANLLGFSAIFGRILGGKTEDGSRALRDFDMWIFGAPTNPYPDFLVSFFNEENAGPGGSNPSGFVNPEYEALASRFQQATELEEARRLAFEMQAILARELPYISLFSVPVVEAYRAGKIEFAYTDVWGGVQSLFQRPDGPLSSVRITGE